MLPKRTQMKPKPKPKPKPKSGTKPDTRDMNGPIVRIDATSSHRPILPMNVAVQPRRVSKTVSQMVTPSRTLRKIVSTSNAPTSNASTNVLGESKVTLAKTIIKPKVKAKKTIFVYHDGDKPIRQVPQVRRQVGKMRCQEIVTPMALKRLKQQQDRRIAFMLANTGSSSCLNGEFLLDEGSLKADQPEGILVSLMDHQKTSIAKMIELENTPYSEGKSTYFTGFLSDATGAGKSLSVLSLICLNNLGDSSNLWLPCSNSKSKQIKSFKFLDLNLILVMPNILHQWQSYLDTQTEIKYRVIDKKVKREDLEKIVQDGVKVVLINNEITEQILALNVKVTRLIIDEIDLYINTRKNKFGFSWILALNINLRCSFCWFLTATPEIMYNNSPQDGTRFHRFPYSCFASLSLDNMCRNLVVKNKLEFVEKNLQLEDHSLEVVRCSLSEEISKCLLSVPQCQVWASGEHLMRLKQMIFCHNFCELTRYFDQMDIPNKENPGDWGVEITSFDKLFQILTHKDAHKEFCQCDKNPKVTLAKNSKNRDKIETLIGLLRDCGSRTLVFANDSKAICRKLGDDISCAIFDQSCAASQLSAFEKGEINVLFLESMESMRGSNMEMTRHLVIFGNPGLENKIQIIGRAQRYGREGRLTVYELRYDGE